MSLGQETDRYVKISAKRDEREDEKDFNCY